MRLAGHYEGDAVLACGSRRIPVAVELFIELDEVDADGRRADEYRTWVGRITAGDVDAATLMFESDLRVELPSGRSAACAVLEDLRIVGLGDPPFD